MKNIVLAISALLFLTSFHASAEISAGLIMDVQEGLAMRGYPVLLSGELDPATREALRQFQVNNGIHPPTGLINESTLRHLQIDPELAH